MNKAEALKIAIAGGYGRCYTESKRLVAKNPALRLVRGWYICPIAGKQEHWWTEEPNGDIVDPTADQFPSDGWGEYVEFDGYWDCEHCGTRVHEDDAKRNGHHVYCSNEHLHAAIGF